MEQQEIQFVGGPLDGLTCPVSRSPGRLPPEIGLPVNPSLLSFLFGDTSQEEVRNPATSIAVYGLQQEHGVRQFRHLCSMAEEEYELEKV